MEGHSIDIKEDEVIPFWNKTLWNGTGLAFVWNGIRTQSNDPEHNLIRRYMMYYSTDNDPNTHYQHWIDPEYLQRKQENVHTNNNSIINTLSYTLPHPSYHHPPLSTLALDTKWMQFFDPPTHHHDRVEHLKIDHSKHNYLLQYNELNALYRLIEDIRLSGLL